MKRILFINGLLIIGLLSINLSGCTNSEPMMPAYYVPIYCNIDTLYFNYELQETEFSLRYTGGSASLAWNTTSQPDWVILQPSSGYLTYEDLYIKAVIDQTKLYTMAYATYSGTITIYSSEGTIKLPTVFVYVK